VPVHACEVCGDCDYGENAEAVAVRAECIERRGYPTCQTCGEEIDIIDGCSRAHAGAVRCLYWHRTAACRRGAMTNEVITLEVL
jgi:hypothetical protein